MSEMPDETFHSENEMMDHLRAAATIWMDSHGDEGYIAGASGYSDIRFWAFCERAFMPLHRDRFPKNWQGPLSVPSAVRDLFADPPPDDGVPTVYVHWGADGSCLYVGRSRHCLRRQIEHRASRPWWDEVRSIGFDIFPTVRDSVRAEVAAISRLRPKYNRAWDSRGSL